MVPCLESRRSESEKCLSKRTGVDVGDLAGGAALLERHLGGHTQRVADLRLPSPAAAVAKSKQSHVLELGKTTCSRFDEKK